MTEKSKAPRKMERGSADDLSQRWVIERDGGRIRIGGGTSGHDAVYLNPNELPDLIDDLNQFADWCGVD